MRGSLAAAAGVISGYAILALAAAWLRSQCLPVSAGVAKWQCDATLWIVAGAYFAAVFVATALARRHGILIALAAFLILFPAHTYLPLAAIVSFGKSWYLNVNALLFGAVPAIAGTLAARLLQIVCLRHNRGRK